jgi:hypothetical protein
VRGGADCRAARGHSATLVRGALHGSLTRPCWSARSNEDDSEDRAMNAFLPEEITQVSRRPGGFPDPGMWNPAGTTRRRVGRAIHGSLGCAIWAQDIQDMQDDFWRRNGCDSYEESSGERQEAHWDPHVPDPDTGECRMPRGYDFREMSMSSVRGSRRPPPAGAAAPLARPRAAAHCCSSPSGTSAPPLPALQASPSALTGLGDARAVPEPDGGADVPQPRARARGQRLGDGRMAPSARRRDLREGDGGGARAGRWLALGP